MREVLGVVVSKFLSLSKLECKIVVFPVSAPMLANADVWNEIAINVEPALPKMQNHVSNLFENSEVPCRGGVID
ncbi:hypothetical protein D3C81_2044760 [compost metagenome]